MTKRPTATTTNTTASESEFLAGYDAAEFERPSVAVDVALITIDDGRLSVVMLERDQHPDAGAWQLPGAFVGIDESLDAAAARVVRDKAGLSGVYTEQLYTFGELGRDPRTRVISVAYYALVNRTALGESELATLVHIDVPWDGERGGAVDLVDGGGAQLDVAFDHAAIVGLVVQRLRGKLSYAPIGYELLPDEFTLLDLQHVHEAILGRSLTKPSFRKTVLNGSDIEPTGARQTGVGHRPAALYRRVSVGDDR